MFFWLCVALAALCIGYRKQIFARFNRSLAVFSAEVAEEARNRRIVSFDIPIDNQVCPGIYDFFGSNGLSRQVYRHVAVVRRWHA